jgi:hypothetical protein
MLENAMTPTSQVHRERAELIFHARNRLLILQSILRKDRTISRTKQWRYAEEASPRCTVVTGPIDLYTGGKGGKTPMRKLIPVNDRVLSIKKEGVKDEKERQTDKGVGGSAPI